MDDLISRQAAYEVLTEYYHHRTGEQHQALKEALYSVPDARPEREIVCCKDCKHSDAYHMCKYVNWYNRADDYCSRAERREDG